MISEIVKNFLMYAKAFPLEVTIYMFQELCLDIFGSHYSAHNTVHVV